MINCKASTLTKISTSIDFTHKPKCSRIHTYPFKASQSFPTKTNTPRAHCFDGIRWENRNTHNKSKARAEDHNDEEEDDDECSRKSSSKMASGCGDGGGRNGRETEEKRVEWAVEEISWRERRIKAEIWVEADVESVWNALTDYERLADFIPNLVSSARIPCPHPGRIWLEQRGLQQSLYWHIEARVVLDLQEFPNSNDAYMNSNAYYNTIGSNTVCEMDTQLQYIHYYANGRELHFSMVDGDFKKFEGKWSVTSGKRVHGLTAADYCKMNFNYLYNAQASTLFQKQECPETLRIWSSITVLSYELNVIPRFNFPAIFLERIIRTDLPVNLQALACRAEKNFIGSQSLLRINFSLGTSSVNSLTSATIGIDGTVEKNKLSPGDSKESQASSPFGPLAQPSAELNSNWGVFGKVCKLDRPRMVDEVHLRRFDGLLENGGVHRCVVASITVKAPVREVWNVLTSYESLPEIVPNLAISKILARENNRVRILQEGCKGLLYMVLHARVVLDLCEHLEQEITFEQVEGDFDSFRGRWLLEQLGNHHTLLKYSVDSKMHQNSLLSEAIMEEVIYEDLPSNLSAIRDYIEKKEAESSLEASNNELSTEDKQQSANNECANHCTVAEKISDHDGESPSKQRPRVPGLQRDIEVLKSELLSFILKHGQEGFMPMRKQLRKHGRVDIEKAITRMGGFRRIASLMNLALAYKHRKPKGYWDNLDNLEDEISRFQRSWGMDPSFMPSRKSFERAGRYDIARALEKWGGLHEVSRLLSLKVRHPNRQPNLSKDGKLDNVPLTSSVNGGVGKAPSKPYVSQDTEKWLMKLKDLDMNWVE